MTSDDGDRALDDLYWQAEILQALYWMRGEGLADQVDAEKLAAFLVADVAVVARHMDRLSGAGYLECGSLSPPRYRLTERGLAEGGRSFRDEFADLTRPGHGECASDCWCQDPAHAGQPCPSHSHHYEH